MQIRYLNCWFFLLIVTLMFCNIPKFICLELIGGEVGNKLSIYILVLGWWLFIIKRIETWNKEKTGKIHVKSSYKFIVSFFAVYILSQIFSIILDSINYPYYKMILSNLNMLPMRFAKLLNLELRSVFSMQQGIQIYLIVKGIKNLIVDSLWTFGGAFLIYYGYTALKTNDIQKQDLLLKNCIRTLLSGILVSVIIISLYAFIELPFLLGYDWARQLLIVINPWIHQIGEYNNIYLGNNVAGEKAFSWWPPLLWANQVRSFFPEPSFFGAYCSFLMPWIWYAFVNSNTRKCKIITLCGILFMSFLIFLTQSRTAIFLLGGEYFLLACYSLWSSRKKCQSILTRPLNILKFIIIVLVGIIAWVGSIWFIGFEYGSNRQDNNNISYNKKVDIYISENIISAASENERSNEARFSLMKAEINVWKDHPLLGVGRSMKSAYIMDYLSETSLKNQEVRMWSRRIQENGPLKAGFPDVSEYTMRLCEMGLVGFLIYFFPCYYLLFYLAKYLYNHRSKSDEYLFQLICFYLISLVGLLVGGLSTSLNATYCLWVLLGVGFVIVSNARRQQKIK